MDRSRPTRLQRTRNRSALLAASQPVPRASPSGLPFPLPRSLGAVVPTAVFELRGVFSILAHPRFAVLVLWTAGRPCFCHLWRFWKRQIDHLAKRRLPVREACQSAWSQSERDASRARSCVARQRRFQRFVCPLPACGTKGEGRLFTQIVVKRQHCKWLAGVLRKRASISRIVRVLFLSVSGCNYGRREANDIFVGAFSESFILSQTLASFHGD